MASLFQPWLLLLCFDIYINGISRHLSVSSFFNSTWGPHMLLDVSVTVSLFVAVEYSIPWLCHNSHFSFLLMSIWLVSNRLSSWHMCLRVSLEVEMLGHRSVYPSLYEILPNDSLKLYQLTLRAACWSFCCYICLPTLGSFVLLWM